MRRFPALIAAAAFAVPMVLALGSTPASAGSGVPVVGSAHCNLDTGHETYTLTWTLTNPFVEDLAIEDDAVESGAFDGTVNFTPNPVPGDSDATAVGTDGPVPNVAGTVSITVNWSLIAAAAPFSGSTTVSIVLDGSCKLPATTTIAPTTTTAAQAALVVRPHFTG